MPKKSANDGLTTADYRHAGEKRKNIPPAKIAAEGKVPKVPRAVYAYSPHLPPALRFDPSGGADRLPDLIAAAGHRPLTPEEQKVLAAALRSHEPWLEWATKREQHAQKGFRVDPVVLHIHERVSAQAIVRAAMREDAQRDLFADPQQPYQQAVQFYKHDVDWANRLILGDSLQVMSSLSRRENLAGKVQMIYMDPPYGIKFASNFQPEVGKRDVKDKDTDLTREPEMVRAYRDTWRLGVHSYLAYLRDRLIVARELLAESGSIFVQISEENLHRVRLVLDEIFGANNLCSQIVFSKTTGATVSALPATSDYLLWYARDVKSVKYRQLYLPKEPGAAGGSEYVRVEQVSGVREPASPLVSAASGARYFAFGDLTSQSIGREKGEGAACWFPVTVFGRTFRPNERNRWKTNEGGMARLAGAERLHPQENAIRYVRYLDDFRAYPLTNTWDDTGIAGRPGDKVYVVQTNPKVIQRCILMATDPGDLVLDPTCGSGTTAYVAEQWGRRWISIDTSRVALAIARQRFLTARFEHYRTKDASKGKSENPGSGFVYKTVPHVTLKSIAQNANLDPIFARHEPLLKAALAACNRALDGVSPELRRALGRKVAEKERTDGKRAVTAADRRRWELPKDAFHPWTVPFDTDDEWPKALREAVTTYRNAWREKMDEVDACIRANAEQEELVDQPEKVPGVVRVSGPFTVEGVRPEELSIGEEGLFDGSPNEWLELGEPDAPYGAPEPRNLNAYLTRMVELLRGDGVTFLNNETRRFARLEPLFEAATGSVLHAEGAWEGAAEDAPHTVAIGFGPQYGPVTAAQIEDLIHATKRYDELIVAGFSFDAEAGALVQEQSNPKLRIHQAHIRPDVNPGMDGLLKDTAGSQIFTVFGQPDVDVEKTREGYVCVLRGVDIYDPVTNAVRSTGADKVAAWFLDTDFDGRCFCITQAFFPDRSAWDRVAKALKGKADAEAFARFAGTTSLPFPAGKYRRVAVKVVDPRGNEVMAVRRIEDGGGR